MRRILDWPELQPARTLAAEVARFLKHKFATNGFSKASTDTKDPFSGTSPKAFAMFHLLN